MKTGDLIIMRDDPRDPGAGALIAAHNAFARSASNPDACHVLTAESLVNDATTFWTVRAGSEAIACGALRRLDDIHAELKSMHTLAAWRGRGVAGLVLAHILDFARDAGYRRISLETGSTEPFAPARAVYQRYGFRECPPFGDYTGHPESTFYTLGIG